MPTAWPRLSAFRLKVCDSHVLSQRLKELQTLFELVCPNGIDYEIYADAFAHRYFPRNFWKAVFGFRADKAEYKSRVADLGCGSGSIILGYLAYLDDVVPDGVYTVCVTLLDKSERQLRLAKELLNHSLPSLRRVRVVIKTLHTDLINWMPEAGAGQLFPIDSRDDTV